MKHTLFALLAFLVMPWTYAQDEAYKEPDGLSGVEAIISLKNTSKNAFQVNIFDALTGNYAVSYERLFKEQHGLVLEAAISRNHNLEGQSLNLSYRKHFRPGMASPFWGVFANYSDYTGLATKTFLGESSQYQYNNEALAIGANVGNRWVWQSGLSLVFRVGYGVFVADFDWGDHRPEDPEFFRKAERLYRFTSGLDAEISVGYCF